MNWLDGGWMLIPGTPDKDYFEREDKLPNPGRVGQIGDIIIMDPSNRIGPTPDNDAHVKACFRHDTIVFMDAQHDGRIYFTKLDVTNCSEGAGKILKGEMAFDRDLANKNTGHAGYESCQWRPTFRWPILTANVPSGTTTVQEGDKITITPQGLIQTYVPKPVG